MYHFIRGKVFSFIENAIVLECNGIGYEIKVPELSLPYISEHKDDILIYTKLIVRDDEMSLVGFIHSEDLELFNLLLKVNGVGPKAALSILSTHSVLELKKIIILEEDHLIAKAQGIGKKTAQRVVLELKDKLHVAEDQLTKEMPVPQSSLRKEATEALTSLGYSKAEANMALQNVSEDTDTIETIIKKALINLSTQ